MPGIYYLRTVAECDAIKHEAVAGRRAAVVGMGFIGCEVVASLAQLGVRITALSRGVTRWNGSWVKISAHWYGSCSWL